MSAQLIAALRRRADVLEAEAKRQLATEKDLEGRLIAMIKAGLCLEFRELAAAAERGTP